MAVRSAGDGVAGLLEGAASMAAEARAGSRPLVTRPLWRPPCGGSRGRGPPCQPLADNLAALAAAMLGVSQRMAAEAGHGVLHEAVPRSGGGYVGIYAVGALALLVLVGDSGLDSAKLHRESRPTVENLERLLTAAAASKDNSPTAAS